jgi:diaminopimelate epimerase
MFQLQGKEFIMSGNCLSFVKMSGTGNDFIMINNMNLGLKTDLNKLALRLCHRRFGVGADGVILIEPSTEADFTMRIFNSDGSEAEMCGNGSRCAARFAAGEGVAGSSMKFRTLAGIIEAELNADGAAIRLTDPTDMRKDIPVSIKGMEYMVQFINTGVPHAVLFMEDVESVPVRIIGGLIRHHEAFKPAGTNVNFVQVIDKGTIRVRTYERGVEDETFACGTGATASALLSTALKGLSERPVKVIVPGGELKIDFKYKDGSFADVWLIGAVDVAFKGEVSL